MKRRDLLRGALGLGVALSLPSLSFASGTPQQQRAALSLVFGRAMKAGKPVLVLVIPADDGEKWVRGKQLGEWLNSAPDTSLAPLLEVEVVCATVADLRQLVPSVGSAEPWFFLIAPHSTQTPTLQALSPTLPEVPAGEPNYGDADYFGQGHTDWNQKRIQANIQAIDAVLVPALTQVAPVVGSLERQAARVRERLVKVAPPGAHWSLTGGCGMSIEGVESQYSVDCGMGHVPQGSQRLLYFFDVSDFQGF